MNPPHFLELLVGSWVALPSRRLCWLVQAPVTGSSPGVPALFLVSSCKVMVWPAPKEAVGKSSFGKGRGGGKKLQPVPKKTGPLWMCSGCRVWDCHADKVRCYNCGQQRYSAGSGSAAAISPKDDPKPAGAPAAGKDTDEQEKLKSRLTRDSKLLQFLKSPAADDPDDGEVQAQVAGLEKAIADTKKALESLKPDVMRLDVLTSRLKQAEKKKNQHVETMARLRKELDEVTIEQEATDKLISQLQGEIRDLAARQGSTPLVPGGTGDQGLLAQIAALREELQRQAAMVQALSNLDGAKELLGQAAAVPAQLSQQPAVVPLPGGGSRPAAHQGMQVDDPATGKGRTASRSRSPGGRNSDRTGKGAGAA